MTVTLSPPSVARQFPLEPGQQIYFQNVSWDYYTRTLRAIEDAGYHYRVTFDRGRMEIMTTGALHEMIKKIIARLAERYGDEMNIPVNGLGQVTCRREDLQKGLEPDECFYITTPYPPAPSGGEEMDLAKHPAPDVAIEVDISRGSISKHSIYAALGVKEIWQFDGKRVAPFQRQPDGRYVRAERSEFLPDLSFEDLNRFVAMVHTKSPHEISAAFVAWLRERKDKSSQ
jgi:Uma2 family endonuclease